MELYKHNQEAYEKVMEAFKTQQRAAIVHATGTGKSYIIAAVAEQFERVCVIAPNDFILDETKKVCKEGVVFKTYQSFLFKNCYANSFDLIVLDEFHRAGACKWGDAIDSLITNNPFAKLLGTSATHIRYLDECRNMADELFEGNIVSTINLLNAVECGILTKPIYVSSLYSIDESIMTYQKRIMERRGVNQEWKDDKISRLFGITSNWENAHGMSHIIAKYLPKDTKRIIIFFSRVEEADKMKSIIGRWFAMAGFSRMRFYSLDYTERYLTKEMASFKKDEDCLKIALSVNMLNEGVHIPNVDSIMMMRTTSSRIITEQQIGRCMSANKKVRPVIFDLVNNIDLINEEPNFKFSNALEDDNSNGDCGTSSRKGAKKFPFDIIDECREIRDLFVELYNETGRTKWSHIKPLLQDFIDKNGRFIKYNDNRSLYNSFLNFYRNNVEDCVEWATANGYTPQRELSKGSIEERLRRMEECLTHFGCIPTQRRMRERFAGESNTEYYSNKKFILTNGTPEQINEMLTLISRFRESDQKSAMYLAEAEKILSETGVLPKSSKPYQYLHMKYDLGTLTDKEKAFAEKIGLGIKSLSDRQIRLKEFIMEHKRTPRHVEQPSLYMAMIDLERRHETLTGEQKKLVELITKYRTYYGNNRRRTTAKKD